MKGTKGSFHAEVFENARTGLKRGLFWNFYVECAPVTWDGDEWKPSFTCDWVTWPVRRWSDLGGMTLFHVKNRDLVQCSFYLDAHNDVRLSRLDLNRLGGTKFDLRLEGHFDLEGYGSLDGQDIPFEIHAEVEFKGLMIIRDNLFPKPSSASEAAAVGAAFMDLEGLSEPKGDDLRYVLEPVRTQ